MPAPPLAAAPLLAAAAAILIWGGSAVAARVAVQEMPPLAVAALRTVPAGLVLLPLVLALRVALPRTREAITLLLLSSACGFVLFPIAFSLGIAQTTATHAAMILAVSPMITGAIAQAWDRRAPPARWWLGGAIAIAGEAVLLSGRTSAAPGSNALLGGTPNALLGDTLVALLGDTPNALLGDTLVALLGDTPNALLGDTLVAIAAVIGALGYVAGGRLNRLGYPAQATTYWGVILASAALLPALPWMLAGTDWPAIGPRGIAALAYIIIGVTVIGYILWYWALGTGGIARIGMVQFAQPVASVLLAALILSEPLGPAVALSAALVIAGVFVATRPG